MEKITLSGMPGTMLQPLYARVKESQTHGAIHDDTAVRLVQQLDYNFDLASKDAAMHNGVIARALVLDKLVSTWHSTPAQWSTLPAEHLLASYIFFIMQQTQYFLSDTPRHGPPTLFFIFYIIHSKAGPGAISAPGPALFPIPNFSLLIPN